MHKVIDTIHKNVEKPMETSPKMWIKKRVIHIIHKYACGNVNNSSLAPVYKCMNSHIEGSGGLFDGEPVSDQGDEFSVGGLVVIVINFIAEDFVEIFDAPPVPGHLDGMADGAFHLAGGGAEMLGNAGIELFCDGVDDLWVADGDFDSFPQVLVSFDMSGNADA